MRKIQIVLAATLLALSASQPAGARTRKGDQALAEGRKAEQRRDWDRALELYERALGEDPADAAYQLATRRVRFQAGQYHVDLGRKARAQGALDAALAEFQKAYAIDPSSAIAQQELTGTLAMIERNKKTPAPPPESGLTPAELARKEEMARIARIQGPAELKPLSDKPLNLRMHSQPAKVLYETVAKLAGINLIFDADYGADPNARKAYSVELNNSTVEDALEYLAILTKTFWRPVSANAIVVAADNQAKRREFEVQAVKVFYLTNGATPQDLTEVATTLRTVADIRKLFQVNSQNAIVVRGTPDQIALAEKLVNDLDKPRAEVVVDVLVMEANRAKTRDLAASIASAASSGLQAGLSTGIVFSPRNPVLLGDSSSTTTDSTATSTQNQLMSLARIARLSTNDFSITLPGALLNFVMSDRNTNVMQSPQVRAASGQKASLRIGDKVPVASGGFQALGTTGTNSLYSQFQFIDVGVNVDITPTVHADGEVTLKVMFEISTVRDRVDVGGISQPVIGQRKVEHEIRIRQGEASLLGGLMQDQETKAVSGVPGLAGIPVLRRLFTSESIEHNESELLIALVPHIVRTQGISEVNLRAIASGSDQNVKVGLVPNAKKPPDHSSPPPGTR